MEIVLSLKELLPGRVFNNEESLEEASEDTSIFKIKPQCVAVPNDVSDLSKLINFAKENRGQLSLTARSAGTDMSGGPLTDSVVVKFTDNFNKIISVTETETVVQPGVYYRDLERETIKQGVILPCYTASKELNTVGGMVANNSAGEKSLTYGKTERHTKELKVMLEDGNEYLFRKLNRAEFQAKKELSNLEGEIYRRVSSLIDKYETVIDNEKPIVSKNSAGYAIWNVWDKENDTFNLVPLFVGSQGTLGFVTEIKFSLVKPKKYSRMLVLFLRPKNMPELGNLINLVLAEKPESFESYDDKTFGVMLRILPKLLKRLGGNPFKLLRDFWPEAKLILTGGIPKLVMMAEFTGDSEGEVIQITRRAEAAVLAQYKVSTHVTASQVEGNKFWLIRRESFKLLRENIRGKHTAPFIDDISVRPEYLPEFLPRLYKILDKYNLIYTVAGHIGDGNFHIIPLMDFSRPDLLEIIERLSEQVYQLVTEYKGSITGEHNDGIIRTPYLHFMFSSEMLQVFAEIKNIFDPDRIFNPHKKVDADMNLLVSSVKRAFK